MKITQTAVIELLEQAQDAYETAIDNPCMCWAQTTDDLCDSCSQILRGRKLINKVISLLGAESV